MFYFVETVFAVHSSNEIQSFDEIKFRELRFNKNFIKKH